MILEIPVVSAWLVRLVRLVLEGQLDPGASLAFQATVAHQEDQEIQEVQEQLEK